MTRKRVGLTLSLFPFLAVLICTMGVLVALLLLVVKQAEETSTHEQAAAVAHAKQEQNELEILRAEVDFRSQLLTSQRDERRQHLNNQRELLGHLESEMAQVRSRAAEVAEQIRALQSTTQATADPASIQQSVASQQQTIEALREQLALAKSAHQTKLEANRRNAKPMYSIVPLAAQSGTDRRPIYIECRDDGMYLYPGAIRLTLDDFVLPLTPGNPLDTALLAYREYWRKNRSSAPPQDTAYPLLVVRPSGAKWYSVARRAMSGWDQEFGYELIPEDWQVNFGAPDPGLIPHVQQAIDAARNRQKALVAYGQATPASQAACVQPATNVSGPSNALIPATGGGFSPASNQANRQRSSSVRLANTSSGNGPDPVASFSSQFQLDRPSGLAATESNGPDASLKEPASFLASSRQTPTAPSFNSVGAGGSGNSQRTKENAPSGSAGQPSSTIPMMAQDSPPNTVIQERTSPASSPTPTAKWNRESMAHERGADWALPSRRHAVSAYYRPVIVQVQAEALVLPPGEGSPRAQTIPLGLSLTEAIDPLANAVWQRVDKWGYLGFDGYWKPVLEFHYTPAQAEKALALQRLLEGSGLEVKLSNTPQRGDRP
jgi:hypothetical protein